MLQSTADYQESIAIGRHALEEASGIACSRKNPGMFWVHEDSGHSNILYLLDSDGKTAARYRIVGATNIDWEDIEIAVGPEAGEDYLYIADTGDNGETRGNYVVYRIVEPVFNESDRDAFITYNQAASQLEVIPVRYPDKSHDVEAMWVDPATLDIYLASKRDASSMLFVLPYSRYDNGDAMTVLAGTFGFREASAGSTDADGSRLIVRNRQQFFYWSRQGGESMVDMLAREPMLTTAAGEVQGEAVCFDAAGNYYSTSEMGNTTLPPPIFKYPLVNNP